MNLVFRYMNSGVEGYPPPELQAILLGKHAVKVKKTTPGMIMLDNNRLIKCVTDYYVNPNSVRKSKKMSNQCFLNQKELGITGVGNYKCDQCHLACIELAKNKAIARK